MGQNQLEMSQENESNQDNDNGQDTITTINWGAILTSLQNGNITRDTVVVLIGLLVVLIFVGVVSIGAKVFCCNDRRKFRTSKDVKCVRHQESMTSPLESPLRSVISLGGGHEALEDENLLTRQRNIHHPRQEQSDTMEMAPQANYATLPTPSVRKSSLSHHRVMSSSTLLSQKPGSIPNISSGEICENGRIVARSVESPSTVYKTSPTKPTRTRKRSGSGGGNGRLIHRAQVHQEDEKAPKGNCAEVTTPIAAQLNEEMKHKLSAIKDPGVEQQSSSSSSSRPHRPASKSYEITPNALTSEKRQQGKRDSQTQQQQQTQKQHKTDPNMPRMWFVSLDNMTPEPVGRANHHQHQV